MIVCRRILSVVDTDCKALFRSEKNLASPVSVYKGCCRFAPSHLKRTAWINRQRNPCWLCAAQAPFPYSVGNIRNILNGGEQDGQTGAENRTRLIKSLQTFGVKLNERVQKLKKGLPMKVLFFLVGFYCSTAFATVIGQTGDWDILSAGFAVVIVEGIGALMYKASSPILCRVRNFITIFNYWKVGLSLGLFLDSFKYEIDRMIGSFDSFDFEIDWFPPFW